MKRPLFVFLGIMVSMFSTISAEGGTIFRVVGNITSNKELTVYGYLGDGIMSPDDFLVEGYKIGTVMLEKPEFIAPPEDYSTYSLPDYSLSEPDYSFETFSSPESTPVTVDFDVTKFFETLPSDAKWIGFILRESESDGSIVALEYLILGTFLGQALDVGVSALAQGGLIIPGLPQDINNPPGPTETVGAVEFKVVPAPSPVSVPEPSTALLWVLGGTLAIIARSRSRGDASEPGRCSM